MRKIVINKSYEQFCLSHKAFLRLRELGQREALHLSVTLADATQLAGLFAAAGFRDIRVQRETREGIIESFDDY